MEAEEAAKHPIATTITNLIIIPSIALLVNNAENRRPSRRTSSMNCNRDHPMSHLHIFHPQTPSSGAENSTITNFIIIPSIAPLVNEAKNGRPLWKTSSTNASGIIQRVVCIFVTHTTHSSGAENL